MTEIQKTPIQEYFTGQSIFITGVTGFLGKIVLEKLLRSCSDIKTVYVLIREKKGHTSEERLEKLLQVELFQITKTEHPNIRDKIVLVNGDLLKPGLGLSAKDKQTLINEVSCIFHIAATIKFTETIRVATNMNVRASMTVMDIAEEMLKLKSFVYVSTAYSNCNQSFIEEKIYDAPISAEKLIALVDLIDDDGMLETITPKLLKTWPNTYCYSKAVTESVLLKKAKTLPIALVRPAIIMATLEDPVSGWSDSIFGVVGVVVGIGLGMIHCLNLDETKRADLVPVDYVSNCVIAAAWDVGRQRNNIVHPANKPIPVFNSVTSSKNPIIWKTFLHRIKYLRADCPTIKAIWYPFVLFIKNPFLYAILFFFLHTMPGYLFDMILVATGRKPVLTKAYKQIKEFARTLAYFTLNEWTFTTDNTEALWEKLSTEDKKIFRFDMSVVKWNEAIDSTVRGIRLYNLKDHMDTIPQARRKMYMFIMIHYSLIGIFLILFYQFCIKNMFCGV